MLSSREIKTHLGVLRPREESETEQRSKLQSQIRFPKLFTAKQEFARRRRHVAAVRDMVCRRSLSNSVKLYTLHRCHCFLLGHTKPKVTVVAHHIVALRLSCRAAAQLPSTCRDGKKQR